jgi:hypothetical protein
MVGYALLGTGIAIAAITFKLTTVGNASLKESEDALAKGDRDGAIEALTDAAKAYVPGARHVGVAQRNLAVIARAAEIRGDDNTALKAWDALRRSILSVRHVFQPFEDTLKEAEKSIIRIREKEPLSVSLEAMVKRPEDPSVVLSITLFVGLVFWIAGALFWIVRPKGVHQDRMPWIRPRLCVAISFAGLAAWVLSAFLIG